MKYRKALSTDLTDITEIYNDAILNTVATFDTETKGIKERKKWFQQHGHKNPIIVAEEEKIIGFAALSTYSSKSAYADTAELSVYVDKKYQGQGIGKELISKIIKEGKKAGLHSIISRITQGNEKSVYLHKLFGFEHVGVYKEVGFKFGKRLDVTLMQKLYKEK